MVRFGRFLVWLYYSTIQISGRARVPETGPLLVVANHANSLIDPPMLGLAVRRPLRFLAKAPLFSIPGFGKLLNLLGMLPIYRPKDAPRQTKHSLGSLAKAAEALAAGEAVGIFPEGKSHDQRALAEIFSGTARILIQAIEAGATELRVLPVGINYDDKRQFRSAVWVEIGPPIDIAAQIAADTTPAEVKKTIARLLASELQKVIIHLEDPTWEPYLEELETLDPSLQPARGQRVFSLRQRKATADALNHFHRVRPEAVSSIGRAMAAHRLRLHAHGLKIGDAILNRTGLQRCASLIRRGGIFVLGLLPACIGSAQNLVPRLIVRLIVRQLPHSGASTVALDRLLVGMPVFLLWYTLTFCATSGYFLLWLCLLWHLATPFAGMYALQFWPSARQLASELATEFRMQCQRQNLHGLRANQNKLRARLGRLSSEFATLRPPLPQRPLRLAERPGFHRLVIAGAITLLAGIFCFCGIRAGFRNDTLDAILRPAPDYSQTTPAALEPALQADEQRLARVLATLAEFSNRVAAIKAGFDSHALSFYNDADTDKISQGMLTYLNCRQELLELVFRYRAAGSIRDEAQRLRASLMNLAAGSALYSYSSHFVQMFEAAPRAQRKLNEGDQSWGIPPGIYDTVRANLQDENNLLVLRGALAGFPAMETRLQTLGLRDSYPQADFRQIILATRVATPVVRAFWPKLLHEFDGLFHQGTYLGQSNLSRAVGNTRVRERQEGPRVQPAQLGQMRGLLKPGDILLERQDWYLSRAFMPGYWAHAALYVGTPAEIEALGLTGHPWIAPHWQAFQARAAAGTEHAIIEAVPDGVRFTTLEHCLGVADSAAILRPVRVTPDETKEAIARAFHHLGKPYDFEFDFFSADKLVCTELVARAFADSPHLHLPMVTVLGRQTLPPTEIVRHFAEQRRQTEPDLALMLFLDGHAHGKVAQIGSEDSFADTLHRPGMTWFSSAD